MYADKISTPQQIIESRRKHLLTIGDYNAIIEAMEEYAAQWKTKCDELEQWKREAMLVMNPIMDYGQSHPDIKLGQSISTFVVERCKQYDELKAENERLNDDLMSDAIRAEYGFAGSSYSDLLKEHAALKERAEKMADAVEQLMSRIDKNSKNTWDLKALLVARKAISNWKEGEQKGSEG